MKNLWYTPCKLELECSEFKPSDFSALNKILSTTVNSILLQIKMKTGLENISNFKNLKFVVYSEPSDYGFDKYGPGSKDFIISIAKAVKENKLTDSFHVRVIEKSKSDFPNIIRDFGEIITEALRSQNSTKEIKIELIKSSGKIHSFYTITKDGVF